MSVPSLRPRDVIEDEIARLHAYRTARSDRVVHDLEGIDAAGRRIDALLDELAATEQPAAA